jgi:hypothetical protein
LADVLATVRPSRERSGRLVQVPTTRALTSWVMGPRLLLMRKLELLATATFGTGFHRRRRMLLRWSTTKSGLIGLLFRG